MIYPESDARSGRITTPAGDLRYINLHGSLPAMAHDLGHRMSEAIRRGALPYLASALHTATSRAPLRTLQPLLQRSTHLLATSRLERNLPPATLRALTALADASGIGLRTVLDAHLMPETLLWLNATLERAQQASLPLGSLGCASLLARDHLGNPLVARNLDYLGANYWERYATLTAYHPERGLSYVAATTAGLLGAGHTAMNVAGLVLTAHPLPLKNIDLQGTPVGIITDAIMRHASSIDHALALLRQARHVGAWSFLIVEGDTGRAAHYACAPHLEHLATIPTSTRAFAHTQMPPEGPLKRALVPMHAPHWRAVQSRSQRAQHLAHSLAHSPHPATLQDLLAFLSDMGPAQHEGYPERLAGPTTIAHLHTVNSAIFDPAHRRVWVAAGKTPASRGWFIPFTLSHKLASPDTSHTPICADPTWSESSHGRAYELYRLANYRSLEGEPDDKLLLQLEHALAHWPHDPDLQAACGLLAMRSKRPARAQGAFERALQREQDPARQAELSFYLAIAIDLQNTHRQQAVAIYKQLAKNPHASPSITRRTSLLRWRRAQHSTISQLPLDLSCASLLLD